MGIKNIHIALIIVSTILAGIFGMWGLNHNFKGLGYASLAASFALLLYGVYFFKKVKML